MRDLDQLIGLIYEAALQPALWDDVLDGIADVTPCEVASLYAHDRIARTPTFYRIRGADDRSLAEYAEHYAATNPIIDALAVLAPGDVAGLATILDYEAFQRHPFYTEWGRPRGYVDAINVMLERTPSRVASVSLIRNETHGLADAGAVERLKRLAPHLLRAVRIARVLDHAEVRFERLSQAVDALAAAVLVLGPAGDVLHANAAGAALLSRGLSPHALAASLSNRSNDAVFATTRDGERHVCHLLPLSPPASILSGGRNGALGLAVVHAIDMARSGVMIAGAHYGLTERERDVLLGLVEIGGAPSTAAALDISVETARSHVKALFRKTGTSRQADLVQLVSAMASPFGAAEPPPGNRPG